MKEEEGNLQSIFAKHITNNSGGGGGSALTFGIVSGSSSSGNAPGINEMSSGSPTQTPTSAAAKNTFCIAVETADSENDKNNNSVDTDHSNSDMRNRVHMNTLQIPIVHDRRL